MPHPLLVDYLNTLIKKLDIPGYASRVALNFRISEYYRSRTGFPPVEIQLERGPSHSSHSTWRIVFVTSFSYPTENASEVDVELYFNFLRGWFYQPDVERCNLHQPKVTALYQSYEVALLRQLALNSFDIIQARITAIDHAKGATELPYKKEKNSYGRTYH
ncbi:DUF2787 family protein [Photobacterium sp. DNB23_23_1]